MNQSKATVVGVHGMSFGAFVTNEPWNKGITIVDVGGRLMINGDIVRLADPSPQNFVVEDEDGNLWVKIPFRMKTDDPRCCEKDTDVDGNCPIHAAPGVLREKWKRSR